MKRAINGTRCFRGAFEADVSMHFLKGFQDDRRLLLHVGKGTARIVHDDLLHIRVKDIRIAKQGTDKRQQHERNEHSLHEGFTALSFQKSHTSSDTKSFIVTGRP